MTTRAGGLSRLNEDQIAERGSRGPQRGSRVGVEEGCPARKVVLDQPRQPAGRLAVLTAALVVGLSWVSGLGSPAAQEKRGAQPSEKAAVATSGKPAAAKEWPPRTADGQPDISGVWGCAYAGIYTLNLEPTAYLQSIGMGRMASVQSNSGEGGRPLVTPPKAGVINPPTGILPYQPWALERRNSIMKDYTHPAQWQVDTQTRGWSSGVPRENNYSSVDGFYGGPIHILQPPGSVVFLYETHHEFRIVPLDGRPQPGNDIKLWEGSSRGRWEGNTLVIDVTNQNDSPRLTVIGDFHSDAIHVTERWTFADTDTLHYQATVDDPKVFTRPWTMANLYKRTPAGTELIEYAGVEGDLNAGLATSEASHK